MIEKNGSPVERTSATSKEFTVLVAFLMSIVALSIDALLPALGTISKDLQLSRPNQAQYLIVFIFIGLTIGQLVCGPLSDAFGRKKVLYGGLLLFIAGSLISYFGSSFEIVLAGRVIQGLGVAGPNVSAVSIVRDKFSGRDMAQVMSLVMMIFVTVPAVAPSLGQGILLFASWRAIFLMYVVYAVLVAVWITFRLAETLPPEKRIPFKFINILNGFKIVLSNPITVSYMLCMGICFGSFIGYLTSSQQIFQAQFNTGQMFTVYFGLLALVLGVASLTNSRFVQRYGMHFICIRSISCIVLTSVVFLLINFVIDIQLWMFLLYAAILFFSFGLMFGNLNALAMEPMGKIAGIASAVVGSVSSAMSMFLGMIIGQLYNNTLIPITSGFIVLGSVTFLIMLNARRYELNSDS
jgi:DHA1 family bicyclomycin/chloramphenicol resistance-like MFS transporter